MNTTPKDLSYYTIRLQELLNMSFPEKAHDSKFIDQRSALAAHAYQDAFLAGNTASQCHEIAQYILFEGLHFSKFDSIFQVVCNEFDTRMTDEELHPFALKMFRVCEPVFANYDLSEDFAYSEEFELLYTELTGTIALWIEENGLQ